MEITLDAYGKVAAKCVIDLFPKQIDTHLLDPLEHAVHQSLRPTDAELSVLLAENQQTIKKRRELLQTIETMKKTEDAFKTFLNISFDEMDGGGQAILREVAAALDRFKASGKPVAIAPA
eukprot:gene6003-7956_t